jgi:hypothetical protein
MFDPMLEKVTFKFIRCIFSSIISVKKANTRLSFILNPYMKIFKCFKSLIFIFQKVYPTHPGVIINKGHYIFVSICRRNMHRVAQIKGNMHRVAQIRMNQNA